MEINKQPMAAQTKTLHNNTATQTHQNKLQPKQQTAIQKTDGQKAATRNKHKYYSATNTRATQNITASQTQLQRKHNTAQKRKTSTQKNFGAKQNCTANKQHANTNKKAAMQNIV